MLIPLVATVFAVLPQNTPAVSAAAPKALILGDTVSGSPSLEQTQAEADGFDVTVIDGATWATEPAAFFSGFAVIIIGDPDCGSTTDFQAAVDNASTWEPVVMASGGARVIIGTDPFFHSGAHPGAAKLIAQGIAFAGANPSATGAYVDLSCAYEDSAPTSVPLLDGLTTAGPGTFQTEGVSAPGLDLCDGTIAIVAKTGPTSGLTDADLSGWSCSVHEFFTKFPSDFSPLALATDPATPSVYCADDVGTADGTTPLACGSPYVMVSGTVTVSSDISLTPPTGSAPAGSTWVVTAKVVDPGGAALPGVTVTFTVDSGPDQGQTATGVTDAAGTTTFSIKNGGKLGTDAISATFVNAGGASEKALATVDWVTAPPTTATPTTAAAAAVTATPAFTG